MPPSKSERDFKKKQDNMTEKERSVWKAKLKDIMCSEAFNRVYPRGAKVPVIFSVELWALMSRRGNRGRYHPYQDAYRKFALEGNFPYGFPKNKLTPAVRTWLDIGARQRKTTFPKKWVENILEHMEKLAAPDKDEMKVFGFLNEVEGGQEIEEMLKELAATEFGCLAKNIWFVGGDKEDDVDQGELTVVKYQGKNMDVGARKANFHTDQDPNVSVAKRTTTIVVVLEATNSSLAFKGNNKFSEDALESITSIKSGCNLIFFPSTAQHGAYATKKGNVERLVISGQFKIVD